MNFNLLNYSTIYKTPNDPELEDHKEFKSEWCFSDLFHRTIKFPLDVVIEMNMDGFEASVRRNNNYCFLTLDEVYAWMNELTQWLPFTYTITSTNREDKTYVDIFLHITGSKYDMKVILTLVRYMYEHPYSMVTKEALCQQKYGLYPELSLFNKHLLISYSVTDYWPECHSFSYTTSIHKFYSIDDLRGLMQKNNQDFKEVQRLLPKIVIDCSGICKHKLDDMYYTDAKGFKGSKRSVMHRAKVCHTPNYEYISKELEKHPKKVAIVEEDV